LEEIEEGITGFARIIRYKNHSISKIIAREDVRASGQQLIKTEPRSLQILSIEEGEFVAGRKNGYARVISAVDGSCEVGFWRDDIPWGKYCKYHISGNEEL